MDAIIIVLWIQYFPLKKISAIIKLFTSVDGEQNENNPHNRTKWEWLWRTSSKISEKNVGKLVISHKFFSSDFNRILRVKRDDKGKSMSPYHLASFSISFLSSCFCFCVHTGNIYCTIELFISCFSFTMLHFSTFLFVWSFISHNFPHVYLKFHIFCCVRARFFLVFQFSHLFLLSSRDQIFWWRIW